MQDEGKKGKGRRKGAGRIIGVRRGREEKECGTRGKRGEGADREKVQTKSSGKEGNKNRGKGDVGKQVKRKGSGKGSEKKGMRVAGREERDRKEGEENKRWRKVENGEKEGKREM